MPAMSGLPRSRAPALPCIAPRDELSHVTPDSVTHTPVRREYDFVVCGGGLAGVCAAVTAARNGLKTALVQDRPVLGGNSSSEVRVDIHGAGTYWPWAVESGVIAELVDEERFRNPEEVFEAHLNSVWDLVLYEWCHREPTLDLYLSTSAHGVVMDAGKLAAVRCYQQGNEREWLLAAPMFLDATGDGTIAALAGAEFRYGREAKGEFDESLAPDEADDVVQGSTIQFRTRDMGRPVPFAAPDWAMEYPTEKSIYWRSHNRLGGFWWIEIGSPPYHTIDDNDTIRHELLRHVLGVFDHIKNLPGHNAANAALDWVGSVPGKRESRRIVGDLILTENHLRERKLFPDRVAYGGWFFDIHTPGGVLAMDQRPEPSAYEADVKDRNMCGPYSIPLRSLRSRDVRNLFLAGRDLSASHVALGSARVMGTCAAMGQAIAAAAAVCRESGVAPEDLAEADVAAIQQRVLKDDGYIPFVKNTDPADLARTATASAEGDADLLLPEGDAWLELEFPTSQIVPVTAGRIDAVELLLDNRTDAPVELSLSIQPRADLWSFPEPVAVGGGTACCAPTTGVAASGSNGPVCCDDTGRGTACCARAAGVAAALAPNGPQWVRFEIGADIAPGLVDVTLDAAPGVFWAGRATSPEWSPPPGTAVATLRPSGCWRFEGQRGKWVAQAMRMEPASRPYGAANVINGVARPETMPNLWISAPGLPQTLTLELAGPATVSEVRIAFDNNLGRITRSTPPLYVAPELVKDYRVEVRSGGEWRTVVEVESNRHRHRVHRFEPVPADALRLVALSTNGAPEARIYEVRVY
jgi:FAD-dependent oxidoreductase family protein